MHLPTNVAIIKCPAYQKNYNVRATGNNLVNEEAKQAAVGIAPILHAEDYALLITLSSLI